MNNRRFFSLCGLGLCLLVSANTMAHAAPVFFDDETITIHGGGNSTWYVSNYEGDGLSIDEGELPESDQWDAFDNAVYVSVNGENYRAPEPADLTGNTLTGAPVLLSGLNTSVQYYFSPTSATVRTVIKLQNPGNAPVTAPVSIYSDLGSDSGTRIISTSSGDTVFSTADRVLITDDEYSAEDEEYSNGDPTITHVWSGVGSPAVALSSASAEDEDDDIDASYNVTVPAGETRYLMLFHQLNTTAQQAQLNASLFDSNDSLRSSDLLTGLTETDLSQVVNYAFGPASGNRAPVVSGVSINPGRFFTNSAITAKVETLSDPDNDSLTTTYQWKKNGEPLVGEVGKTLQLTTLGNGDKGDLISVVVTANDGKVSTSSESSQVAVTNASPLATSVSINPNAPIAGSVLTANPTGYDPDGDSISFLYLWMKNGVVIPGETGPTLNLSKPGNGTVGDEISVLVKARDRNSNSSPLTSLPVTIVSDGPGNGGPGSGGPRPLRSFGFSGGNS